MMADAMAGHEGSALEIRRTTRDDLDQIIGVVSRAMGEPGDQRDREFYAWKHFDNPFGESPSWAAFDGDRMVAFRTMMRWEFVRGSEQLRMVRAVDTATDPEYQGRGLFRRLTMRAVQELAAEGVDAVFNTPNDQSRPGYLKMEWEVIGRPTLWVQPKGPISLARMLRARVPAEKWSEPTDVGESPSVLRGFDSHSEVWHTRQTTEFLDWRFGFAPLNYRVVEIDGGVVVFRVRRRGELREVAVCSWLSNRPDRRAVRRLVGSAGDYAVGLGLSPQSGFVPVPRQGPVVTWRRLASSHLQPLSDLDFQLSDLELF